MWLERALRGYCFSFYVDRKREGGNKTVKEEKD